MRAQRPPPVLRHGVAEAIESALQLPDPAADPGHGAAYARFLAIYNELRYGEPQLDIVG